MAQQIVDVVAQIQEALQGSAIADIRLLQVESDGERVVLRGTVGYFYYKQLAQELVRRFANEVPFENTIVVEYREYPDEFDWRI